MTAKRDIESSARKHAFSTFGGVFTPSILTILGVIMFLRAGFVIGRAGVGGAIVILLVAEGIALLTALSLAAIASNTPVGGGGAYFLISRVLGPGLGGAVGLALYCAQAFSVPFYVIGFSEAVVRTFPALREYFGMLALGTTGVLFAINYVGAGWAIRTQYAVMTLLGLAILSFLGGAAMHFDAGILAENWSPQYTAGYGFWALFALYFPAVTGIMAGVNMSGDLKEPGRSLVRGTLAAIGVGAAVYLLEIVLCGGAQSRAQLIHHPYEMLVKNALPLTGFLVVSGVFAATLSSAMGSLMGAPRVMQALARDRVIGGLRFFSGGAPGNDEPRPAMWLSLLISVAVILWALRGGGAGAFNLVAALVSMFFLATYGMINLAAFVELFGSNPSYRPRFRHFHWSLALAGVAGCVVTMFLIHWWAAILACVVVAGLYLHIRRRTYAAAYGDARRGFVYALLARALRRLEGLQPHPKNWRPTFLVLSGNPVERPGLIRYAVWLEAGRGIVSVVQVVVGRLEELAARRREAAAALQRFVERSGWNVYAEVIITRDFAEGVRVLLQSHSIGPIKPNTVLLGWPREPARQGEFAERLRDIHALGMSILCVVGDEQPEPIDGGRIDIWWRGMANGSLMVILAYLLTCNWEWRRSRIRILRVVGEEAGRSGAAASLRGLVEAARIDAEIAVVVSKDPFAEILPRYSQNASVVFLGLSPPERGGESEFFDSYERVVRGLSQVILVLSNGEADLVS